MQLTAQGCAMEDNFYFKSPCCFAGEDDQFVVGASEDNNIYVWLAPIVSGETTNKTPVSACVAWTSRRHPQCSLHRPQRCLGLLWRKRSCQIMIYSPSLLIMAALVQYCKLITIQKIIWFTLLYCIIWYLVEYKIFNRSHLKLNFLVYSMKCIGEWTRL